MVVALLALGAGLIAATIVVTAARYGDLPESIPVHFGIDGRADSYGPRLIIWLPSALQSLQLFAWREYCSGWRSTGRPPL